MVRGGRSGRGSTSSGAPFTYIGLGVRLPADYAGCPDDRVRLPDYAGCPGDRVRLPDYTDCPDDSVRLPDYVGCPGSASHPVASPVPSHSAIEVESHLLAVEEVSQPAGRQPCWISG
ncbi:hypothetical protein Taro_050153 [Colocasia esculenta]|uniref:Uncharacterized protein n=1 Tax=Colocasia esculenta TaxID=4460 RepID=A0A843XCN9_COLES|nr:hypothetical protein [Colocasia esculenta]